MSKNQEKEPGKAAAKFPLDKLSANCRALFGVSSCTFAGATHGLSGEFTVEEMKEQIDQWSRKGVK